jgi:chitinase
MANSPQGRTTFINSVVSFMRTYGFDGFDLDWEYPGMRGGAASDRAAFTQLLIEMRTRFDQERWLLTAAVAAVRSYHSSSYEVPNLSRYLDFINVMAYDLHGSWDGVTGQNAPLYASPWETSDWTSQLNVDAVMRAWIASGASPQKLVMGVGFYGRSYTLASAANNGVGAPTIGAGAAGPYTQEPGFLGYNEICERIRNNGWIERWDNVQQNPYAVGGNQWVGYDSIQSLTLKVQRAKAMNLGGVMIWSIDTDDFRNGCGQGTYPLLRALNREIGTGGTTTATTPGAGTTTTTRATTTTTRAATTTTVGSNTTPSTQLCNPSGFMRDPTSCSRFYRCDPS